MIKLWVLLSAGLFSIARITLASPASTNNYTVTEGETTCVVMVAGIQLQIPYVGQSSNTTATINVPLNGTTSGHCEGRPGENSLTIAFFNHWSLTIVFGNTSQGSPPAFHWKEVELQYVLDRQHFPDIANSTVPSKQTVHTWLPEDTFRAGFNRTYRCSNPPLTLNQSIILQLSSLWYTAFKTSNSTTLPLTDPVDCEVTFQLPPENFSVVIGVGIGLATLTGLLVLIYIIAARLRTKKN